MAGARIEAYRTKSGHERWRIRYRDPATGEWRRKVLDNAHNAEQAREAAVAFERKLFLREWYPEEAARDDETVGTACARRRELAAGRSSEAQDRGRLEVIEAFFGADTPLHRVTVRDVVAFRDHVSKRTTHRGTPPAPATVRHYQVLLRHVMALAVKEGTLVRNTASAVPLVRVQNQRDRLCSRQELATLLEGLPDWLRVLTILGYETGMRLGELVALDPDKDYRLGGKHPSVRVRESKTNRPRTVPLTASAVRILRELGAPVTTSASVSPSWKRWMAKIGVEDLKFHDLRHTWATRHWLTHRDMLRLMVEGGWTNPTQLTRYVNLTSADIERAEDLLILPLGTDLERVK